MVRSHDPSNEIREKGNEKKKTELRDFSFSFVATWQNYKASVCSHIPRSPFWRLFRSSASQAEYMSRSANIWATATKSSVFPLAKKVNGETWTEQWHVYIILRRLVLLLTWMIFSPLLRLWNLEINNRERSSINQSDETRVFSFFLHSH